MPNYNRKKKLAFERKQIAKERIKILFSQIRADPENKHAPRYAKLIFSISKKYRVPKPSSLVKRHCSHCFRYSVIGKTSRIRVKKGKRKRICTCGKSF